jgi:hypothetical protein
VRRLSRRSPTRDTRFLYSSTRHSTGRPGEPHSESLGQLLAGNAGTAQHHTPWRCLGYTSTAQHTVRDTQVATMIIRGFSMYSKCSFIM